MTDLGLIYYDSLSTLRKKFPGSCEELEQVKKDLYDLCLGLENSVDERPRAGQIFKAILTNTIPTAANLAISLSRSEVFITSTYSNYEPDFGKLGSFIVTALYGGPKISDHFFNFAVDKLSANLTF